MKFRSPWLSIALIGLSLGAASLTLLVGGADGAENTAEAAKAPDAAKTAEEAKPAGEAAAPVPGAGEGTIAVAGAQLREGGCITDPTAIDELKQRRAQLEQRQAELGAREAELKARERALEEEIRKITAVRDEITKIDGARKKENDERVTKLVETIETMSPKAGSTLLASVDEQLAVAAMARINTPKLAKIMNVMEPKKGARLSELLTGVVGGMNKVKGAQPVAATTPTTQPLNVLKKAPSPAKEEGTGLLASSLDIPLSPPKKESKEGGDKDDDGKNQHDE